MRTVFPIGTTVYSPARCGNGYADLVIDAADRVLAWRREDGALNCIAGEIADMPEPPFNHHWGFGEGDDKFILRNDDGVVVVVLAAYRITGDSRYLDAMVVAPRTSAVAS